MNEWFHHFLFAFVPIFVAIDPVGLVPLFLGITHGVPPNQIKQISYQATLTAAGVAIGFVFLGKAIFGLLGITVADFQIAGGLILIALATRDLLGMSEPNPQSQIDIGVVPLGTPLIAGPALITTLLLLIDTAGIISTLVALTLNLVLVSLSFRYAKILIRVIGKVTLKAISKVIALLLAAIAVSMVRRGFGVP